MLNHKATIKRLFEATELLSGFPQAEAWGFGLMAALRAVKSAAKSEHRTEYSNK
ncbi:MAG: hypothetical protein K2I08_07845 [Muribaculaceae bacterium]|nr:hypothetical protein [Muribaculaceae bacterium]